MVSTRYLFEDNPVQDLKNPPQEIEILLEGNRGTLLTMLFTPQGAGPHPTILLFHGFPGNEQMLDAGYAFRRIGFNVITLHYSGCYGSEGHYSLMNDLDDAKTLLAFVKDGENREKYGFDPDNILLFGQSLGGFVSLHTLADSEGIKGAVVASPFDFGRMYRLSKTDGRANHIMYDIIDDGSDWINTSREEFYNELERDYRELEIESKAERLAGRTLSVICSSYDTIAVPEENGKYIYDRVNELGKGGIDYMEIPSTHNFSDRRCTLIRESAERLCCIVNS